MNDQCLILSYAHGIGVAGPALRDAIVAEVDRARKAYASAAADGKSMGVEAGFVRSLMHDVVRGHPNDVHLALHFFPTKLGDVVFIILKLKEDGNVAVDVLDLRPNRKSKETKFHGILVNAGHARSLQLPSQWDGQEGSERFLEAVRNRGAVVENYQYRGWQDPLNDQSGPRMTTSGQVACELCGEPGIRPLLREPEDEAGRWEGNVKPVVSSRIMEFMLAEMPDKGNGYGGASRVVKNKAGVLIKRIETEQQSVFLLIRSYEINII